MPEIVLWHLLPFAIDWKHLAPYLSPLTVDFCRQETSSLLVNSSNSICNIPSSGFLLYRPIQIFLHLIALNFPIVPPPPVGQPAQRPLSIFFFDLRVAVSLSMCERTIVWNLMDGRLCLTRSIRILLLTVERSMGNFRLGRLQIVIKPSCRSGYRYVIWRLTSFERKWFPANRDGTPAPPTKPLAKLPGKLFQACSLFLLPTVLMSLMENVFSF